MQEILVVILFITAAIFMGRKIYMKYKAPSGCASAGCDACAPTKKSVKLPEHFKSYFY
ncbi:FeoB-associated Cys-rich membrane protein [Roseivirga misakiensis]|uniref:FeoB-associated Cys-rich membrane protein n=1 Tax=Roseivirga misakiensis TaxID=1563681 RepID=UPI0015B3E89E|nr:FeoB-associated Cys-rich membrane protein [Roseivirga misakiensis]